MGYSWSGCAGVDHRRPYYEFPQGPYQCPQNRRSVRPSVHLPRYSLLSTHLWAVAQSAGSEQLPCPRTPLHFELDALAELYY